MQATRDYCAGDSPNPAAVAAAAAVGADLADLSSAAGAVVFNPADDIVAADLVLVMDKYTAADVLREVSCCRTCSKEKYKICQEAMITVFSHDVVQIGHLHVCPSCIDSRRQPLVFTGMLTTHVFTHVFIGILTTHLTTQRLSPFQGLHIPNIPTVASII